MSWREEKTGLEELRRSMQGLSEPCDSRPESRDPSHIRSGMYYDSDNLDAGRTREHLEEHVRQVYRSRMPKETYRVAMQEAEEVLESEGKIAGKRVNEIFQGYL